jgi:formylglycine-generating enzyme required for sulfatase activity
MAADRSFVDAKSSLEYVWIPPGEFRMGTPEPSPEIEPDARPVHRVRLSGFWMARTEVTRAQYSRFMRATGRPKPQYWDSPLFMCTERQPVIGVTWDDAAGFCKWADGRLPTEAEWEYAARGSDGRRFPWGSDEPRWPLATRYILMMQDYPTTPETRAIFNLRLNDDKPNSVGTCPAGASPFGVLDLAGNASEWCSDWYAPDYYAHSPVEDPTGPPPPAGGAGRKVVRGGSWASHADGLTATRRASARPSAYNSLTGIRCVRTTQP